MPKPKAMLTWEIVKTVAELDGYTYTITQDEWDEWGVEIDDDDPDGGFVPEVFNTIEEAKQFCENTAVAAQG